MIKKIELVGTADGKPSQIVKIVDCGDYSASKIQDSVEKEKGNNIIFMFFWSLRVQLLVC